MSGRIKTAGRALASQCGGAAAATMDPYDAIEAFDDSLLGSPLAAGPLYDGPSPARFALPPPRPAPLAALLERMQAELGFPDGPALLRAMERWNEDLFSCLPTNADLYADAALLSADADAVVGAMYLAVPGDAERLDLNAHANQPLPAPPASEEGLPEYVAGVQAHFLAELRAREERYAGLFLGYCRALLQHLRATAARGRGAAGAGAQADRLRQLVAARYYREASRLARLAFAHMYVATAREVSWRLHSQQSQAQGVFVSLYYAWPQRRQFTCLFHPVLFNHGVVALEDGFLDAAELRRLNYRRRELGLPLVRAGLVEVEVGPLVEEPPFSGSLPRALGFLNYQVRAKMGAPAEAGGGWRRSGSTRTRGRAARSTTGRLQRPCCGPRRRAKCCRATPRQRLRARGEPRHTSGSGAFSQGRRPGRVCRLGWACKARSGPARGGPGPSPVRSGLGLSRARGSPGPGPACGGPSRARGGRRRASPANPFGGTYDALLGDRLNQLLDF
uniref:Tegument protein VP16 homolog n=1 Tax=Bovine herpesvirus 1.1 (strain P8-2) TaxID=10324 RepID=VP16_BHV1P|nr:RecName: Full=Tegument protein VP16 homolog; AltName: Full=Alpha trans-inducing protein; AltName: Full=Alpha-TIF [Bovine herpesvirus type 1.1 (strain P8-2)]CAA77682.1 alpha gene transinducing factor [Bovine alphaherpesvirus 1]